MAIDVTQTVKLLAQVDDKSTGSYLLIALNEGGDKWKEFVIDATKLISEKELKTELIARGHRLCRDKEYWLGVFDELERKPENYFQLIKSPGWYKKSYISSDGTLLGFLDKRELRPQFHPDFYKPTESSNPFTGNREFRETITPILKSSSRAMLAACAAFSGYLAPFTDVKTSGFHLYGKSSIGKSTVLGIAASIQYGLKGVMNWNMTEKGLEEAALAHNHNILILDELKLLGGDPKAAAKKAGPIVYTLAQEVGKNRSVHYENTQAKWKLCILSAGERSLYEHAQEGQIERYDGENVRLIDIPADTGSGFGIYEYIPEGFNSIRQYVSHVTSVVDQSRGGARRFIKAISFMLQRKGDGYVKAKIAELVDEFLSLPDFAELEGQKERILKRFGLAYAAGVIASEKRCIGLSEQELQTGLTVCALAALESVHSPAESEAELEVGKLCKELTRLARKTVLLETKDSSAEELKAESVIIHSFRDGVISYAISTEYFDQVVDQAHRRSVKKLLAKIGILVKSKDEKSTQRLSKLAERRYCLNQEAVHRYLQKNEK